MPGAARPRGVGIAGAGAWVITSQRRQAYFGRTCQNRAAASGMSLGAAPGWVGKLSQTIRFSVMIRLAVEQEGEFTDLKVEHADE